MKRSLRSAVCLGLLAGALATRARAADDYVPGPDSKVQPGVPKGEVLKFTLTQSTQFPGTQRDYWIYVPAQYRPDKPACLYVGQDGIRLRAAIASVKLRPDQGRARDSKFESGTGLRQIGL